MYSPVFAIQEQVLLQCCYSNGMDGWQWARALSTGAETANAKFRADPLQNFGTACAQDSFPISLGSWFGLISLKGKERLQLPNTFLHYGWKTHEKVCPESEVQPWPERQQRELTMAVVRMLPSSASSLEWKSCVLPWKGVYSLLKHS